MPSFKPSDTSEYRAVAMNTQQYSRNIEHYHGISLNIPNLQQYAGACVHAPKYRVYVLIVFI